MAYYIIYHIIYLVIRQYQLNNLVDDIFEDKNSHTVSYNKKKLFDLSLDTGAQI